MPPVTSQNVLCLSSCGCFCKCSVKTKQLFHLLFLFHVFDCIKCLHMCWSMVCISPNAGTCWWQCCCVQGRGDWSTQEGNIKEAKNTVTLFLISECDFRHDISLITTISKMWNPSQCVMEHAQRESVHKKMKRLFTSFLGYLSGCMGSNGWRGALDVEVITIKTIPGNVYHFNTC